MKTTQTIEIPYEVLMECLGILTRNRIKTELTQADDKAGLITVNVIYDKSSYINRKAMDNITQICNDFTSLIFDRYANNSL